MMKQWTTLLVFLFLSLSLSAQQEYGRDIFVSSKGDWRATGGMTMPKKFWQFRNQAAGSAELLLYASWIKTATVARWQMT